MFGKWVSSFLIAIWIVLGTRKISFMSIYVNEISKSSAQFWKIMFQCSARQFFPGIVHVMRSFLQIANRLFLININLKYRSLLWSGIIWLFQEAIYFSQYIFKNHYIKYIPSLHILTNEENYFGKLQCPFKTSLTVLWCCMTYKFINSIKLFISAMYVIYGI